MNAVAEVQVYDGDGLHDDQYRQYDYAADLIKELSSFEVEVRKLTEEGKHAASYYVTLHPKTVDETFSHFACLLNWLDKTESYERAAIAIIDLGHLAGHLMECGYQHHAVRLGMFIAKVNVIHEQRSR